jgi:hypothetical protein
MNLLLSNQRGNEWSFHAIMHQTTLVFLLSKLFADIQP